jgi:phospholipid/cholesterol/gamma-HCH transport system permease protein
MPVGSTTTESPPTLRVSREPDGAVAAAAGDWNVRALAEQGRVRQLRSQLDGAGQAKAWDLTGVAVLDHSGAMLLWQAWGRKLPADVRFGPAQAEVFERLRVLNPRLPEPEQRPRWWLVQAIGHAMLGFGDHLRAMLRLVGQLMLDILRFASNPWRGPWREISANIYHAGAQALGITALVGFLIGVVLSYLSSQQLRLFGADIFIVNILGMSVVRELGPVLAAILVAGRSGSAITAQIGVMRVTEELDAMLVMGIPHGFRLIMPRVLALAVVMPLLVVWTDAMALLGGMVAANIELGLSFQYFLSELPESVSLPNVYLGVFKGAAFGMLIALVACHYGLRVQPNTESLGRGTTSAVVVSITTVILTDAVFAILFKDVGF